jgi:tripartite-type tricarboxylate transporter receptor subunit TctC
MFANLSAVIGNVKAGTLRALAVTSAQRSPSAPDIPTVGETALPGFDSETWFGIVAPAGTPAAIRTKLNTVALKALDGEDTKKRYLDLGMVTRSSSPEEFDAYIKAEVAKWSGVIKEANVQALD